jgi:hypothetical protein
MISIPHTNIFRRLTKYNWSPEAIALASASFRIFINRLESWYQRMNDLIAKCNDENGEYVELCFSGNIQFLFFNGISWDFMFRWSTLSVNWGVSGSHIQMWTIYEHFLNTRIIIVMFHWIIVLSHFCFNEWNKRYVSEHRNYNDCFVMNKLKIISWSPPLFPINMRLYKQKGRLNSCFSRDHDLIIKKCVWVRKAKFSNQYNEKIACLWKSKVIKFKSC